MLSLFVTLLLLATAQANLNLSHLRVKRLGHPSNHVVPRTAHSERFARRGDGDLLGDLGGLINGGSGDRTGSNSDDTFGSPSDSDDGKTSSISSPTITRTSPGAGDSSPSTDDKSTSAGGTAPPPTITRTDPVANSPTNTPTPTSSSDGGLLGLPPLPTILSSVGNGLGLGGGSSPAPSSSPSTNPSPSDSGSNKPAPTSSSDSDSDKPAPPSSSDSDSAKPAPTSSSDSSPPEPTSSSSGLLGLPPLLPPLLPTPSQAPSPGPSSSSGAVIVPDPTTDNPPQTPSSDSPSPSPSPSPTSSGFLGLPPLPITSILSPILPPPSASPSSSPSGTGSDVPIIPDPTTSRPAQSNPPSGTPSPTSSDDGGILPPILPTISLPPVSVPPILPTSSPDGSANPTTDKTSPTITIIPTDVPTSGGITILPPVTTTPSITSDEGAPTSGGTTAIDPTTTVIGQPTSGGNSSIISLPTSLFPSVTPTAVPSDLSTVTPSSSADDELSSQFSFITASSIETFSAPSTTISPTETDPDAALTSTSVDFPDPQSQTASPTQPTIPPSLPTRIFGPLSVDPNTDQADLQGKTLVSLLFKQALNWNFVNKNSQTVGQVFAFFPGVLVNALELTDADVKTYALQVQVPNGWDGTNLDVLGTVFLAYIPNDQVENLASLLRAPNSRFYKQPTDTQTTLANLVSPAFPILSVSNSDVTGSGSSGGSNSSKSSSSNKTRTDAIIGVCSAVGGVAALVGLWWVLRFMQRRQAAKHRRLSNLSDPNASNGVYGTQHDDRRTSFFYAEDELRGGYSPDALAAATAAQQQHPADGSVMQQRTRPVVQHTPISAPVLQQSSLNW